MNNVLDALKHKRVIVCGGRSFEKWSLVQKTLAGLQPSVVIQGGAPGADRLAAKWADVNGVPLVTYPALRSRGKAAGPLRNRFMMEDRRPDLVVAFPGGRGTRDCIAKATEYQVAVMTIEDK